MGTDLTTGKLTPTNMETAILICSLLSAASAGPFLVNMNGVYLPHQYSSAPYPTAYGYAAGPAHAVHVPQAAVSAAAVPAVVKSAPVAAVAVAAAPVAAVQAAPVAAVHAAPAVQTVASSQYHAQDEAGNYKYGYKNINSAKEAAGNVH